VNRPTRAAAGLLLACACTLVHERAADEPVTGRAAEKGMLRYEVRRLSFVAPDSWDARGHDRRLTLLHPDGTGRIEVDALERTFRDEAECLANAEESLKRSDAQMSNLRRHPSSFAGRKAIAQEADRGGWHGWAWAVCDGAAQYRVFFAGKSPVAQDVLAAWRAFTKSAAIGGDGGRS
jgi:hypothetical protein